MNTISFLLLRLTIGISFFGHGLVRFPKLQAFSNWMVGSFKQSMLPTSLVMPFSYILPFAEFTIGFLLITGLLTKYALLAGGIVMLLLLFGTTMIESWEAIPSQIIHVVLLAVLLHFLNANSFALDHSFNK
ncbi:MULTISPECIES: DoxX family protein [Niastella]|uniref:DoxX family membrane protein n=1 Tax=Niastella soli TaxID=2821487 RepID=A0ABS3YL99_9BACT|nr:DoxX family membrane protein [Niastella soli]MBO9198636.1 DoxX family membrane protein [Niastella soli]